MNVLRHLSSSLVDRLNFQILRQKSAEEMVFGIGLSKTGTSSLSDGLGSLGYQSQHYSPCFKVVDDRCVWHWSWWLNRFNAHSDLPVAAFFEEIDRCFPQARFIYTIREKAAWLDSCRRHFTAKRWNLDKSHKQFFEATCLHREMLGSEVFNEDLYWDAYRRHDDRVRNHFQGSPRFAIIDVDEASETKWQTICGLLKKDVPTTPFPCSNQYDIRAAHVE